MPEKDEIEKDKKLETEDTSSPAADEVQDDNPEKHEVRSAIRVTRIVFLLAALIFIWYIYSDRRTPYTTEGSIMEIVIPITPRVSGNLLQTNVHLNSVVKTGDLMFVIDTSQYAIAVRKAKANLRSIIQDLGAQSAGVDAAASSVGVARAQLDRAQRNYDRAQRVIKKNPGALSQADIDRVETSLSQAQERMTQAEAGLVKAKSQLGPKGANNPMLQSAITDLNNAQLQLSWAYIYAPADGFIESYNLDKGYFCKAGKPIATLLTKEDLWIQANFKENNLSNMKTGNKARFILDIAPGRVFEGYVKSIGFGVGTANKAQPGHLPKPSSPKGWLQDPQRFPVVIGFDDPEAARICRAGGQVDVVVYTGDYSFLNTIADFRIWINSKLSYVR